MCSIDDLYQHIAKCLISGGKILVYGNGGCAAIADHFVSELVGRYKADRAPLAAISLNGNNALLTCICNDFGYERAFSRQIDALGNANDVVIGLTTSGKSKNILEALYAANRNGCESWLMCGAEVPQENYELCNNIHSIESTDTAEIQNQMLRIIHAVSDKLDQDFSTPQGTEAFDIAVDMSSGYHTLLLDRDGVINQQIANGYVLSEDEIVLSADFIKSAKALAERFDRIIVVTNQRCVAKGLISKDDLDSLNSVIVNKIAEAGGRIDAVYTATNNKTEFKPNIGLADKIKKDFQDIDFSKSVMIGDSFSDYLFAKRIGATYLPV